MDFHGFLRIPMDLCIPADSYGFLWVARSAFFAVAVQSCYELNFLGHGLWLLMTFEWLQSGFLWIPTDFYRCLSISMAFYGLLRIPNDSYGVIWISIASYGVLWTPMILATWEHRVLWNPRILAKWEHNLLWLEALWWNQGDYPPWPQTLWIPKLRFA